MIVDPACPVEWSHPLNVGLTNDWTITPNSGWRGALRLLDLVRGGRTPKDGTLTGTGAPFATWTGNRGRLGGFGALLFNNATGQYVAGSVTAALGPNFTFALWAKATTATNSTAAAGKSDASGPVDLLFKTTTASTVQMRAIVAFGGTNAVATDPTALGTNWNFFVVTVNGTTITLYRNGVSVATATGTGALKTSSAALDLARHDATNGGYWPGLLDGAMIYRQRLLQPREVSALYEETRKGNPERLRWLRLFKLHPDYVATTGRLLATRKKAL